MRRTKPVILRYAGTKVSLSEMPGETALCMLVAGCPHRCRGCRHPELRRTGMGQKLTVRSLTWPMERRKGITCVCLMGGDTFVAVARDGHCGTPAFATRMGNIFTHLDGAPLNAGEAHHLDAFTCLQPLAIEASRRNMLRHRDPAGTE